MKETLLLYHVDKEVKQQIERITSQLHVHVLEIDETQLCQSMGYILGIAGFEENAVLDIAGDFQQEFIFFAGMTDQQLDIILQLLRMQDIPKIPYKAMLTEHNIHYPFCQLYLSVKDEYQQMSQMNSEK